MAVQYHPDKHGGQKIYEEKFKSINLAYQTLGDSKKKALYDQRLLYGFSTSNTSSQTSNQTQKKGNSNTDTKKKHTYKKKVTKEYSHTSFQKKLIKTTYILIPFLIVLSIIINLTYTKKDPSEALHLIKKNLKETSISQLNSNFFLSAEPYIDSLSYINHLDPVKDSLQRVIFTQQKKRLNNLIAVQDHKEIISNTLILKRMEEKYNLYIPDKYVLNLANSYFENGQKEKGITEISKVKESLNDYTNMFLLSDIYLRNNLENEAYETSYENHEMILNFFRSRLGFRYYSILSTDTISIPNAFTKELLQHQVLRVRNEAFNYQEENLLDNYLTIQLQEKEKRFYQYLKSIEFLSDNCSIDSLKYYNEELHHFRLDKTYP